MTTTVAHLRPSARRAFVPPVARMFGVALGVSACAMVLRFGPSAEWFVWPIPMVLSPFAGIGSEGYVALQMGRRFVGAELKASYFGQASRNLAAACVVDDRQPSLFATV